MLSTVSCLVCIGGVLDGGRLAAGRGDAASRGSLGDDGNAGRAFLVMTESGDERGQIDARDDAHLRIVQKTMGDVGRRRAENVGEDQHALIRREVRDEPAGFRLALLNVHVAGHVEDCDGVAEGVARGAEDVPGTAFQCAGQRLVGDDADPCRHRRLR